MEDFDVLNFIIFIESKNMRKNIKWVFFVFMEWRKVRMVIKGIVIFEFVFFDIENINLLLGKFVIEVWKKDGLFYFFCFLYMIIVGLFCYMCENGNYCNFLDEKNFDFYEFCK